jgi:hypothetical protein
VILVSYLFTRITPLYSALSVFTDWWQLLPFIRISVLRTLHATCIFMSHRVSLVKSRPLQIRALHNYGTFMELRHVICNINWLGLGKSQSNPNRPRTFPGLLFEYSKFVRKIGVYGDQNIIPRNKLRQKLHWNNYIE